MNTKFLATSSSSGFDEQLTIKTLQIQYPLSANDRLELFKNHRDTALLVLTCCHNPMTQMTFLPSIASVHPCH